MQNDPIHVILEYFFFFATFPKWKNFHFASLGSNLANAKVQNPKTKFRQSGKFSTKREKFLHLPSGMQFGKREGLDAEKKNHQSGKFSTKSGKISTSAECSNSCDFGIKKNFFGSGKFSTKVEKIPLPLFGIKLGVLVSPDEQKVCLPKWKLFHQKWKSCSTPRGSLSRAVFETYFFAEEKH